MNKYAKLNLVLKFQASVTVIECLICFAVYVEQATVQNTIVGSLRLETVEKGTLRTISFPSVPLYFRISGM